MHVRAGRAHAVDDAVSAACRTITVPPWPWGTAAQPWPWPHEPQRLCGRAPHCSRGIPRPSASAYRPWRGCSLARGATECRPLKTARLNRCMGPADRSEPRKAAGALHAQTRTCRATVQRIRKATRRAFSRGMRRPWSGRRRRSGVRKRRSSICSAVGATPEHRPRLGAPSREPALLFTRLQTFRYSRRRRHLHPKCALQPRTQRSAVACHNRVGAPVFCCCHVRACVGAANGGTTAADMSPTVVHRGECAS